MYITSFIYQTGVDPVFIDERTYWKNDNGLQIEDTVTLFRNIVYLELPLNVPVDTNLSLSPYAALALGRDFYAKVLLLANRHCVVSDLI